MARTLNPGQEAFIEMTNKIHGGAGWELGRCLWSPEKAKDGKDSWKVMRDLQVDDLIIHSVKTSKGHMVIGTSKVESTYIVTNVQPPYAGKWGGYGKYYRVDLKDFQKLEKPMYLQGFLDKHTNTLNQFKKSFFTKEKKPAQKYLTHLDYTLANNLIQYFGL